jgi:multimeric flavodoxin WrbA
LPAKARGASLTAGTLAKTSCKKERGRGIMKILGIAFSAREDGNCLKCVKYCLDKFKEDGFKTEVINAYELTITPCSHCRYECFANNQCPIEDDVDEIYKKCDESDILIFAIPTYGGHLSSLYFAFAERGPASLIRSQQYAERLLKKMVLLPFS